MHRNTLISAFVESAARQKIELFRTKEIAGKRKGLPNWPLPQHISPQSGLCKTLQSLQLKPFQGFLNSKNEAKKRPFQKESHSIKEKYGVPFALLETIAGLFKILWYICVLTKIERRSLMARRILTTGKAFKRTDGRWGRSEEHRVGKECRSRWSPYH